MAQQQQWPLGFNPMGPQTATATASMGQPMQMVQQQQWPQGFNQQQQFYNQGMLSQMLMSQCPGGNSGVMAPQSGMGFGGGPMQMLQQQQWPQGFNQQQQFYNQGMLSQMLMSQCPGGNSGVMAPQLGMGFGGGPMQMLQQQQWQQQQTQMGFGGGMIGQTANYMIPQTNRTMVPTTMMSQQATGMVPQYMNSAGGVPGIQQGVQGGQQVQGQRRKKKKNNKDEFLAQQRQQRHLQQQQAKRQQQLAKYGPTYYDVNTRCRRRMKKNYRDAAHAAMQMEQCNERIEPQLQREKEPIPTELCNEPIPSQQHKGITRTEQCNERIEPQPQREKEPIPTELCNEPIPSQQHKGITRTEQCNERIEPQPQREKEPIPTELCNEPIPSQQHKGITRTEQCNERIEPQPQREKEPIPTELCNEPIPSQQHKGITRTEQCILYIMYPCCGVMENWEIAKLKCRSY